MRFAKVPAVPIPMKALIRQGAAPRPAMLFAVAISSQNRTAFLHAESHLAFSERYLLRARRAQIPPV